MDIPQATDQQLIESIVKYLQGLMIRKKLGYCEEGGQGQGAWIVNDEGDERRLGDDDAGQDCPG